MGNLKRITAIMTVIILIFTAIPFTASALTSGDWTYTVSGSSATITKYSGSAASVSIPSKLGNYTVTTIGEKAFDNCDKITSVTFPSTVTTIMQYAFYDCDGIKTLTIGSGVKTIGFYAFEYCVGMTSVTIPASVTSIEHGAFSDCYSLTKIEVNGSNTVYKSVNGILFSKDGTTLYTYPAGLSGSYSVPSSVKTIESDAFSGCRKMTSIILPSTVTKIGDYAFFDCSGLTSFNVPASVTRIGASTFERCIKLNNITLRDGLTSIGGNAFAYCSSLKNISLPETLITLGKETFLNCTALSQIYIPKSTTAIANNVFSNTNNITAYVYSGSTAHTYCKNNNIDFELISATPTLVRLSGASRYDTANNIAKSGWTSAETVILANGTNFADSLVGVTLSKAFDAPILLTANGNTLESSVTTVIKELGAKKVIILGGTSSVNDKIKSQLTSLGYTVERISGTSRFQTAVKIGEKLVSTTGKNPSQIFIAYGYNYPDALSVSSAAGISGSPILFMDKNGVLDSATAAFIKKYPSAKVTILGGTATISSSAESNIKALGVASVDRVAGSSRYDTALKINQKFNGVYTGKNIAFATGESFPDALAGGAFAAKNGIPLLLVSANNFTDGIAQYISSRAPEKAYIFGGESTVPNIAVVKYLT